MNSGDITKEYDPLERILTELVALRGYFSEQGTELGARQRYARQRYLEEQVIRPEG